MNDRDRLLEIGKNLAANDAENLAGALERAGADASTYLLPEAERWKRWGGPTGGPMLFVSIPAILADAIVAILLALPRGGKKGRRSKWHPRIGARAYCGLLERKPVRALAREISELTGEDSESVRRQLNKLKASRDMKAAMAVVRVVVEPPGAK